MRPRGPWIVAGLLFVVLMVLASRYGFHRDEFYFIEGGRHPDWAQPDNPILIPLLATAWHDLVGGNLIAFRILPALAGAGTILIAAATARQLGGTDRQQTITALVTALSSFPMAIGHLFSISTFDLLLTSAVIMLLIRALRTPDRLPGWLWLGVITGIALEVKVLPALVLACCLAGLLLLGPRAPLARPGPWIAAGIALLLAAPNLIWQAVHGFPMREIAANIAAGGSASSADRIMIIPMHLLLIGPLLSVLAIAGLVATFVVPRLRDHRWVALAYLLLLIIIVITGGKPYYQAGLFPVALALGVIAVSGWLLRVVWRRIVAIALLVVVSVPTAAFSLPVAPVGSTVFEIAAAVNPDSAETVGWDDFTETAVRVAARIPAADRADAIVLASNYGEAGSLARARRLDLSTPAGPAGALPPIYSGHNAFGAWGPPPAAVRTAVVIGEFDQAELDRWFSRCEPVEEFASPPGVDNEEDGAPFRLCTGMLRPWPELWPEVRRLG
ncbi:glycosyltransferase family 39 protein [Microlunatus speluncae]|uniref:glycosyltransferase family 39 protein n=1 Tax=Microlunatus speluncae TaxID=2594267 RepID=UPI001266681D|nr:glycosyltransferase family 39 protein [Microlunatus speluncae]